MGHNRILVPVILLFASACQEQTDEGPRLLPGERDASATGSDVPAIATGGSGGMGGMGGMGGPTGGAGGGPPELDAGPRPSCSEGEYRCLAEGDSSIERCREDGSWALDICPDGGPCYAGQCLPNPAACRAGERICLDRDRPADCDPGQAWVPAEPCAEGEICVAGVCDAPACAQASLNRSYLGCEYFAVELPNLAFVPSDESTLDAPTGVVVVNPSMEDAALLTVFAPDGAVARLLREVAVNPPPELALELNLRSETVRSEVRDARGALVAPEIGQAELLEIPPGGTATLLLPRLRAPNQDTNVSAAAFRLRTDHPIAAYQFNPYCCNFSFSNDASLLIPTSALGADYRFLGVPAWSNDPFGLNLIPAAIAVIGTRDGTEVSITLPRGVTLANDPGGRVSVRGQQVTVNLDLAEVATLQTASMGDFGQPTPDLSGARISSNHPISVFSSHMCSYYPSTMGACDHLEEQLFPTGTLGQQYVLVPLVSRTPLQQASEVTYWKILATYAETRITLSVPFNDLRPLPPGFPGVPDCRGRLEPDGVTLVLQENAFCEFGTQRPVAINADGRLMVMGIVSGQESTGISNAFGAHAGDPSIFLMPPDLQYRSEYAFLIPGTYFNDYLTVVADADTVITLDGQPLSLANATPVPGSTRVYKHVPVEDGPHQVSGDKAFGIVVFAFDDFVSYAFTGGLNLIKR